jgi:hypothetical protein
MVPQWLLRVLMVTVLVASSMTLTGCELAGGIFKAGMWVGVVFIVLIIAIVGFIAAKIRG